MDFDKETSDLQATDDLSGGSQGVGTAQTG